MALKTGIVKGDIFLKHITEEGCPERPDRLKAIYSMLDKADMRDVFVNIAPRAAKKEEILLFHTDEYFKQIAKTDGKDFTSLTSDTHACADSYQTALFAAGGLFEAISLVMENKIDNAFALVRPPGHHAEKSKAVGYCLFNNIALAAIYAQKFLGLSKIMIIDWDVHHGNGTQHGFESDPSVLFFSIHQAGIFPGTGMFTETGLGDGEGYTINVSIPKGCTDAEFVFNFLF